MGLPAENRLTRHDDFFAIKKYGKKYFFPELIVYIYKNNKNVSRLAVIISGKFGDAVLRNRVKRLIREVFRIHIKDFSGFFDILIIPQKKILDTKQLDYFYVEELFLKVYKKLKVI
ncbi:MAG: ribonuclease P protein component [Elusimicrobia bacterium]|nr:ribonuclease P protein component [Elusimicrobiota bacterium]